jgi:hypothetical protein
MKIKSPIALVIKWMDVALRWCIWATKRISRSVRKLLLKAIGLLIDLVMVAWEQGARLLGSLAGLLSWLGGKGRTKATPTEAAPIKASPAASTSSRQVPSGLAPVRGAPSGGRSGLDPKLPTSHEDAEAGFLALALALAALAASLHGHVELLTATGHGAGIDHFVGAGEHLDAASAAVGRSAIAYHSTYQPVAQVAEATGGMIPGVSGAYWS